MCKIIERFSTHLNLLSHKGSVNPLLIMYKGINWLGKLLYDERSTNGIVQQNPEYSVIELMQKNLRYGHPTKSDASIQG